MHCFQARHKIELERSKAEIEVVQKAKDEEMEEVHKRFVQGFFLRFFIELQKV